MTTRPKNLLLIMTDEHNPKVAGYEGHPQVRTPNMDRLAAAGTRFSAAYSNSPLCVPARAVFATGRYVHDNGCWDNAIAYGGGTPGWGHRLQKEGNPVASIGKLHYLKETDPTGFDEQILPMHIAHGVGDLQGLIRDPMPVRYQSRELAEQIGPGETGYIKYDRMIADAACEWFKEKAETPPEKPWVLFVSFISPHYPLIVPQEYYDLYPTAEVPMPKALADAALLDHPWWKSFRGAYIFDRYFADDEQRRIAIASYFGLCTFVDEQIGKVLDGLEASGLGADTNIVYTSDHGDNLGTRGLWGKSTMYEESARIPMIVVGDGIDAGAVSTTPVSQVDIYQTVLDSVGLDAEGDEEQLPGNSLLEIAGADDDPDRTVFSEYHAAGSVTGAFMLRRGDYKYVHYLGFAPELYNLADDPEELTNLGGSGDHKDILHGFEDRLRNMVDMDEIDSRAKADQAAWIEDHGGREKILDAPGINATPSPVGD